MAILRLPPFPTIRDVIKLYRLSAIKQLSQNFLLDEKITDKIVKCAGKLGNSHVVEVGPGPGSITRSIIKKSPKRLIVVEKDKRFEPTLTMLKDALNVSGREMIVELDDIMNFKMENLFPDEEHREWDDVAPNIHIIGNLPFSISTILIIRWLKEISEKAGAWSYGRVKMTLTFQKEVAERLVAPEGGNQRCRLSVMAQTWTHPKLQFIIPGNRFVPKPDVDVGVVTFTPLKRFNTYHKFDFFEKINRHMFSFRQKHCHKCMGTLFPPDLRKELSNEMCKLADIDPTVQVYHLSVEKIDRIASAYQYLCEKYPEIKHYDYRASRKVISSKYTKSIDLQEVDNETVSYCI